MVKKLGYSLLELENKLIHGSIVAIVTPFADGAVDYGRLEELIEFHIESGTHGIVPVGTTGESPTLSHAEHEEVIKFTVDTVKAKGSRGRGAQVQTAPRKPCDSRDSQRRAGADAALVVTPYYNKPTQEGVYRHFRTIADETSVPLILYNVPGRTVVNIEPETVERLFCDCESHNRHQGSLGIA